MRRRAMIGWLLLIGVGVVLGTTVFRIDIAQATGRAQSVTVDNTTANPVPVREQNTDANGNIKVHEQGTANVNVANSSLTVAPATPVTDGGGFKLCAGVDGTCQLSGGPATASALSIGLTSGADEVELLDGSKFVAKFFGPAATYPGPASIVLALNRPVTFDAIFCLAPSGDGCSVSWVGNSP
jgi:hypothetical protein